MAVGPSAPPMIAIDEASAIENSMPGTKLSKMAPNKVAKMPN
ncbi:Uncharacterised protein [Vibrio cholerae]|nr:Uncharacterised protein [Vibrio cholerae]